jgi:hypothetical protein
MTEFTDVKFMTAQEKARTAKQWEKFLAGNMDPALFTKAVYHHLMQHCNHIAHYDRGGFYAAQCAHPRDRVAFLLQFGEDHQSGRLYWGANEDYRDLGNAMFESLDRHCERLLALAQHAEQENLRETIARQQATLDRMEGRTA